MNKITAEHARNISTQSLNNKIIELKKLVYAYIEQKATTGVFNCTFPISMIDEMFFRDGYVCFHRVGYAIHKAPDLKIIDDIIQELKNSGYSVEYKVEEINTLLNGFRSDLEISWKN